jgi:hypothetical protein
LNAANLELNCAHLTEQWSSDEPLEDLWKRISVIHTSVAVAGGNPITDGSTIELTLEALQKSGVYDHAITPWYDKDATDHTWANFMLHFTKHEKERHRKLTARTTGFHGANIAKTPVTPEKAPAPFPPINAYVAKASPASYDSNNITLYYCWTHGLSHTAGHTSHTCENKAEDHQDAATLDNRMGSVNKIAFGHSGKARQVKTKA